METISKYFPDLTADQIELLNHLLPIYLEWNEKVNVISRKDIDHFYERHVLHSLCLSKVYDFRNAKKVMDLGTGGGFPGIPLAILFPDCQFVLVDSIRKKLNVVQDVIDQLGLKNVQIKWSRSEEIDEKFDVVITRAVARLDKLLTWTKNQTRHILALKGGDLADEIKAVSNIKKRYTIYPIHDFIKEDFFETKVIIEINR